MASDLVIEIVAGAFAVDGEGERFDRQIDLAPPYISFGAGMFDQPLVLGRAAGFGSGVGNQRTILGDAGRPYRSGSRARRARLEGGCGGFRRP